MNNQKEFFILFIMDYIILEYDIIQSILHKFYIYILYNLYKEIASNLRKKI